MSIRKKFVIILGVIFLFSLFLSAVFYNRIIISHFKETELLFIKREFISFSKSLDSFLDYLSNIVNNETEHIIRNDFFQKHKKLKLDFFIVLDKDGKPVSIECYLSKSLCEKIPFLLSKYKKKKGFLLVDGYLLGVAINRFSRGSVVVGKVFKKDFYSGWLHIKGTGEISKNSKPLTEVREGSYTLRLYDTSLSYYSFDILFEDILGRTIHGFQGTINKVLWNKGHLTFHLFQFVLTLIFIGILSFVFFSIDRLVAKPINSIIKKIKNISKEKDLRTVYENLNDDYGSLELNQLSEEIRNMILRLESLLRANSEKTQLFRVIAENAPIGIALYTEKMEYVNPAIEKITGYTRDEIIGKDVRFLMGGIDSKLQNNLVQAIKERLKGKKFRNEFQTQIVTKDGKLKDIWVISNTVKLSNKYLGLGIVLDITEIKNLERKLNELLDKDTLTGLLSRFGFTRKVGELLEILDKENKKCFLLIVDISRFKIVNDSYGHQIGDKILLEVSSRLKSSLHPTDLIGRLAADEFGIFISRFDDPNKLIPVIDRIIDNIEETITVEDYPFNLTCSIGISVFPNDGTNIDTLLKRADIALARAKEKFIQTQKSSVVFFSPELEDKITHRLNLERELRIALENKTHEFYVEYQPIYNLKTLQVEKLEALVRWNSSKFGELPPLEFIPIAEETGLIKQLTTIVLNKIITHLTVWRDKGINPKISINISPAEFKDADFVEKILKQLKPKNFEKNICIEITENVLLDDVEDARKKIKILRQAGIEILLDDFGTGYSSLTYLRRFPISVLKIDREFIRELPDNEDDKGIVITIVQLSQLLSMDAIAEGIENEQQANFLKEIGCKYGQGYYFSKPVSFEAVENLFRKNRD